MIKMINDSREGKTITLMRGEAFCQGLFVPYGVADDEEVTGIRTGGFGSTSTDQALKGVEHFNQALNEVADKGCTVSFKDIEDRIQTTLKKLYFDEAGLTEATESDIRDLIMAGFWEGVNAVQ